MLYQGSFKGACIGVLAGSLAGLFLRMHFSGLLSWFLEVFKGLSKGVLYNPKGPKDPIIRYSVLG